MNKKLALEIVEGFGKENIEEISHIVIEGVKYSITEFNDDEEWIDEGKYQYSSQSARICSLDKDDNVLEKFDFWIEQDITRSGSHFSEYYYEYDNIKLFKIEKVIVPEVIIPEHEEEKKILILK